MRAICGDVGRISDSFRVRMVKRSMTMAKRNEVAVVVSAADSAVVADSPTRAAVVADMAAQTVTVTVPGCKAIVVNVAELADDIKTQAMYHGLRQKLGDSMALSRDPVTGRAAAWGDKHAAAAAMADRLARGLWNERAEGGSAEGGLLRQALRNLWPAKTAEAIDAFLTGLSKEQEHAIRTVPSAVKTEIDRIRAARVKADVDVGALLAGFGG